MAEEIRSQIRPDKPRRVGAPPRYDIDHWKEVALVYSKAYLSGGHPTAAVAKRFPISKSTAAKWVQHCRKLGLLGQTEKRKAGGILERGDSGEHS
jgi:hypothetical protein